MPESNLNEIQKNMKICRVKTVMKPYLKALMAGVIVWSENNNAVKSEIKDVGLLRQTSIDQDQTFEEVVRQTDVFIKPLPWDKETRIWSGFTLKLQPAKEGRKKGLRFTIVLHNKNKKALKC